MEGWTATGLLVFRPSKKWGGEEPKYPSSTVWTVRVWEAEDREGGQGQPSAGAALRRVGENIGKS